MNTLNREHLICLFILFILGTEQASAWGFYGHKLINQQAVYSLPWELQKYFHPHVDYISRHAVDPDKRRYALKEEAFQHYFDTEKWSPFVDGDGYPNRVDLLWSLPSLQLIDAEQDTSWVVQGDPRYANLIDSVSFFLSSSEWDCELGTVRDTMAHHGILPITIVKWYYKLVRAFEQRDMDVILKVAADLGHYIGDAHVPLHTTVNYNGQLTDQIGIHALWETHVPEWMADQHYDFVVGRAEYIPQVLSESWNVIRASHELVSTVLNEEKALRANWPDDREICPRKRTNAIAQLPCPEYLEAYHQRMNGMVEQRMRQAILSISSFWWSAYVDAGQPPLELTIEVKEESKMEMKNTDGQVRCD